MARKTKQGQNVTGILGRLFKNKLVLTALFYAVVLGGIFYGLWYFFHNSRFFTVNEIVINSQEKYGLWEGEDGLKRLYLGRNIFNVNPRDVRMLVKRDAPQFKTVVVRRVMPDRLEIDIVPREPVAYMNTGGGLIIDKDAVILAKGRNRNELVEIKGIRFFFSSPSEGEKVEDPMLDKALSLLKELNEKGITGRYRVGYVNVSDRNNILLDVLGVIVKMGEDGFSRKIDKLKEILEDPDVNIKDIKYIDLRFESPIISPR
ncbi:MAG: cell division protein FtsQ/DivIB [Candidatus Omnitrophota bacterium]